MTWTVLKLGGTSVSAASHWERVAGEVRSRLAAGERVLVVQSALMGVTDLLERLLATPGAAEREAVLGELDARHRRLADEMRVDVARLAPRRERLARLVLGAALTGEVTPRVRAEVLAQGELLASELSAAYLAELDLPVEWCDARELLVSTPAPNQSERAAYLNAICDPEPEAALQGRLAAGAPLKLTQGFIARDPRGRHGACSAAGAPTRRRRYFARQARGRALRDLDRRAGHVHGRSAAGRPGAAACGRSTTTRPRRSPPPAPRCCTRAASSRCARRHPARHPLHAGPAAPGTTVGPRGGDGDGARQGDLGAQGRDAGVDGDGRHVAAGRLPRRRVSPASSARGCRWTSSSTSETNVTRLARPGGQRARRRAQLERLHGRARRALPAERDPRPARRSALVGRRIRAILHASRRRSRSSRSSAIHLVTPGGQRPQPHLRRRRGAGASALVARAARAAVPAQAATTPSSGRRWESCGEARRAAASAGAPWWARGARSCCASPREASAALRLRLPARCARRSPSCAALAAVDRLLYAVKANPHPDVLRALARARAWASSASRRASSRTCARLVPGIEPSAVLFTPNFAPRDEYRAALAAGVARRRSTTCTAARALAPSFRGPRALPAPRSRGTAPATTRHVRTAGAHSKFGIPLDELERCARAGCARTGVARRRPARPRRQRHPRRRGLARDGRALARRRRERFPDAARARPGRRPRRPRAARAAALDLERLDAGLRASSSARASDLELWLEPGRFLVARAGRAARARDADQGARAASATSASTRA